MSGIITFKSVEEAIRAGYHVYDRNENGYLVRIRLSTGWGLAIVDRRK